MPSQRNINQLAQLKEKLGRAKSVMFADYAGLSVGQQTILRGKIAQVGGEFTVAKNNLLKLALEEGPKAKGQGLRALVGPTAVLFSYRDEVMPLKVMVEFAKGAEKPTVKGGFLGVLELTAEQVLELAKLSGKNELIVQLLGRMQGPMYGFVGVLMGNLRNLVYVINARKQQLL